MDNLGYLRELKEYENEKKMQEKVLNAEKVKMSILLKGELGQDMHDVLSGKKKVTLSKKEIISYKFKFIWHKIMLFFDKLFLTC